MYYIGIDLGTSAVKLLLMDEKGTVHKVVSKRVSHLFSASGLVRAKSGRLVCAEHRGNTGTDGRL